jgi:hypothetical protein
LNVDPDSANHRTKPEGAGWARRSVGTIPAKLWSSDSDSFGLCGKESDSIRNRFRVRRVPNLVKKESLQNKHIFGKKRSLPPKSPTAGLAANTFEYNFWPNVKFRHIYANFLKELWSESDSWFLLKNSILLALQQKSPKESIHPDSIPGFVPTPALPDGVFLSQIWGDLAFLEVVWRFSFLFGLHPFYTLFGVVSGIFTSCLAFLICFGFFGFFLAFWAHFNRKCAY